MDMKDTACSDKTCQVPHSLDTLQILTLNVHMLSCLTSRNLGGPPILLPHAVLLSLRTSTDRGTRETLDAKRIVAQRHGDAIPRLRPLCLQQSSVVGVNGFWGTEFRISGGTIRGILCRWDVELDKTLTTGNHWTQHHSEDNV